MSGRVGRDQRFRRDFGHRTPSPPPPSSSSGLPLSSRGNIPPSRHLWVGNLPPHIMKPVLIDHLVRFGELESVSLPPGRTYAFVNYVREDDALAAMDSLQGFLLDGMPLRIQFAKADKPPRDESYVQHRDELHPSNPGSAFSKRDSRVRHASPDAFNSDSSRRTDNSTDQPSEILWIGYPSFLKVDDTILRKAFSPFGEIEKITAFPGRTYAFVQFRSIASACRAKETLQGKLFGNPRVHICFARSDTMSTSGGRRSVGPNAPPSTHFKHDGRAGSSDKFDPGFSKVSGVSGIRQPHFSKMEYRDPEPMSFSRKDPSWTGGNGAYEERNSHEFEPDPRRGLRGYRRSPSRDRTRSAQFHEISPQRFPRKSPLREDPWDLPEDVSSYHGFKKLKTGPFPQEELPEYPLPYLEQGKHGFTRALPDLPPSREAGLPPYNRPPDNPVNFNRPLEDLHDWRSSRDTFDSPPPFSATPLERKRTATEFHRPAAKEWKWEGTISKGGTPVCRARCFPVGKVLDFFLPEFLDCTARTGLDMLAKHYYQAAASWVVFFVAASDADMGYYNEFMHYLGEKQRAAVSKLDERHTLFLVPPSDFSENVLKVPGKLSISGVVLRLAPPSPSVPALPPANEAKVTNLTRPYIDNTSFQKSESSSVPFHSLNVGKPGISSGPAFHGNIPSSAPPVIPGHGYTAQRSGHVENRHDFQPSHPASTIRSAWSPQPPQNSGPSSRDSVMPQRLPNVTTEYQHVYGGMSYPGGGNFALPEQKLPGSSPLPPPPAGPQPHAHQQRALASSLSESQSMNPSSASNVGEYRPAGVMVSNQPGNSTRAPPDVSSSVLQAVTHATMAGNRGAQEAPSMSSNGQDEGENDPQKRLQATLQLAAALLQQIQQGKGT